MVIFVILKGTFRGICKKIDHFPQDADYEQDAAEYLLRAVRESSIFPIMSVGLLFMGGAGIFFVSAGLSNIIGIIVYISANSGDPGQSDSKKSYSYGWSFYFGALSFIMAEMVGVLAVHMFIEKHDQHGAKSRTELIKKPLSASAFAARIPQLPLPLPPPPRPAAPASPASSPRCLACPEKGFTGPAGASSPSAIRHRHHHVHAVPGEGPHRGYAAQL
ncbi:hypothetical protein SKAU_G00292370 [Synaphobranchus kaupii]|uniref:Voltage-dependent calcium channel gamma-3 subunit n=1 Tax=Synaphobranchus kaupii TaxID=118154 RepID=A0A9Q1IM79_SYNKA|nr:hypothetical protein SKAU_G00292370 [Synaphobranchus kaupii]